MNLRNLLILVSLVVGLCSCDQKVKEYSTAIIPSPSELASKSGVFKFDRTTKLIFDEESSSAADVITQYLASVTSLDLDISNESGENSVQFKVSDQVEEGSYQLNISEKQIILTAANVRLLLLGFQSIRQLLLLNDNRTIPALEITDKPAFEWRGLQLDCSRHFMEKDFVKRYIDLLSLYKMNTLHWHLTEDQGWRIEIDKYPKLTEIGAWRDDGSGGQYGGYYSKDDIREVVQYAEARGVNIVPEIELPGHSQAALAAYPQFSCTGGPFEVETEWGVFKEIYCAGNDSTFTFLEDVLTEVIELFPSEYIHIGGDEVPKYRWEHCDKCQRRMRDEGLHDEHELQSYFIGRIGGFLASKGKKMIGWDEILEGGLPAGAIVQSWRGFEGAEQAVKSGSQAILSPTSHAYFDYGLNDIDMEKVYSFDPIPNGLSEDGRQLILGGECNMWSERAPQESVDQKVFPRILAMAEVLWRYPEQRNYNVFKNLVRQNYSILNKLNVNYGFETVPVKITSFIDGGLRAQLIPYDSTLTVHYFEKGKKSLYSVPVGVEEPANWAITFSRAETTFKDTIYQSFKPHMANGLSYELSTPPNKNYKASGEMALTDGLKGSNHFRDGNWQGFWGEDVELTLDFGETKEISSMSAGFLQYNNAWIFYPVDVKFEVSNDGEVFEEVGLVSNVDQPENKKQDTQQYTLDLIESKLARYVKIKAKNLGVCPDWHDAAGSPAWLFIDEFSVE